MDQRFVGSRIPGLSDTQVFSRAGGASGGLPVTPPPPLIHNRVQIPVLSCAPEPQPSRDPHSLPQPEGDSPKAWGEGTPVFCFSSSFLSRKNGTIAQAPAPHPPHRFLRFLLPLSRLPAPAPVSALSPAQLPAGEERVGGGGFVGEEGARDGTPTPPSLPCSLLSSLSLGGGKGQEGCPSPP